MEKDGEIRVVVCVRVCVCVREREIERERERELVGQRIFSKVFQLKKTKNAWARLVSFLSKLFFVDNKHNFRKLKMKKKGAFLRIFRMR